MGGGGCDRDLEAVVIEVSKGLQGSCGRGLFWGH